MKDWYFVLDGVEKGVEAQVSGEQDPLIPLCVTGSGTASRDSLVDVVRRRAEITEEIIGLLGRTRRQGLGCGKEDWK